MGILDRSLELLLVAPLVVVALVLMKGGVNPKEDVGRNCPQRVITRS